MKRGFRNQTTYETNLMLVAIELIQNHPLVEKKNYLLEKDGTRSTTTTYGDLANYAITAHLAKRAFVGSTGASKHVGSHDSGTGEILVDSTKISPNPILNAEETRKFAAVLIHEGAHGLGLSEERCKSYEMVFFLAFNSGSKK